ncbi:hypothetical protein COR50_20645 [Chitinophaga caeni]|uniref:RHS repeat-associated core domain-containing protein n=1 Tax=Chitinophaga caeni TaxID=2029983 RepID=A0A291QZQ0_9BACT|nr:RHS repeat-associated core domain-containing protein [Chitinophaga caeni]ATL49391.1 hypothetical protein COR50_20645 [Chitinophaga caeni]
MRVYDPRIGRFLSVDPLAKDYPELTPYQFASNRPIECIDLDGGESAYLTPGGHLSMPSDALRHPIPKNAYVFSTEGAKGALKLGTRQGIFYGVAALVALDFYLTGGTVTNAVSKFAFATSIYGALDHNPATTEEGKVIQSEKMKDALVDLATVGILHKAFGMLRIKG